jgi:hypothetical protein
MAIVVALSSVIAMGCSTPAEDDGGSPPGSGGVPGAAGTPGLGAMPMAGGGAAGMAVMPGAGTTGGAGMAGMLGVGMMAGTTGGAAGMTGGVAGMAGMAGMAAGSGAMPPEPHEDLGMGDGHDVVLIGDSWMNLGSVGIQQSVIAASGQAYRAYGVPGTRLLDEVIPNQYVQAKAENPDIKTVIMSGGGNDILQNPLALLDCPALGETCKSIIDMVGQRYIALTDQMAADGVEDIIIINYSRNTLLGAAPVDYSTETITPTCETAPLRCHTLDPDEIAGGLMELRDGIHPTDANYDLLGDYIYDLMAAEGMRR